MGAVRRVETVRDRDLDRAVALLGAAERRREREKLEAQWNRDGRSVEPVFLVQIRACVSGLSAVQRQSKCCGATVSLGRIHPDDSDAPDADRFTYPGDALCGEVFRIWPGDRVPESSVRLTPEEAAAVIPTSDAHAAAAAYGPVDAAFTVADGLDEEIAKADAELRVLEERRTRLRNAREAADREIDRREAELDRWRGDRVEEWLEAALRLNLRLEKAHRGTPTISYERRLKAKDAEQQRIRKEFLQKYPGTYGLSGEAFEERRRALDETERKCADVARRYGFEK